LDFIAAKMWPLNSPEVHRLDHHDWGSVRDLSQSKSKKRYHQTKGNAANDSLGMIERAVKDVCK